MNTVITVLLAVLVFGLLILIHEFGHYLFARLFRVGIHEFSIGMGPKIVSHVSRKTGIEYSLRLLPVGGYVSMVGEDGASDEEGALSSKPRWQRAIVLCAGAAMNLLLGFIVMMAYVLVSPAIGSTTVDHFVDGATSESYGLREGDTVLSVDGKRVHTLYELTYEISYAGAQPIEMVVERDGVKVTLDGVVFPTVTESGVTMGDQDFYVKRAQKNVITVCKHAYYQSVSSMRLVWQSLVDLVRGKYGIEAVSGPVGVSNTISEAASYGLDSFLLIVGLITINLGIFNLLPFPALDGGRVLFLIIEAIRRKPIKPEIEGFVNFVGLLLLFGLMAVVTIKDIIGIF